MEANHLTPRPAVAYRDGELVELRVVWNAEMFRAGRVGGLSRYRGRSGLAKFIRMEPKADPDERAAYYRPSRGQALARWRERQRASSKSAGVTPNPAVGAA
jgi:hypothetical protein